MAKLRAIFESFNSHDCEAYYRCPKCGNVFGSWSIYGQKENENGNNKYCPFCKEELDGLD